MRITSSRAYEYLGLKQENATSVEIKDAFFQQAQKWTTNVDDIDRECFLNINAAYVRLTSGDKNDELLEEQFHAAYSDSSLFEGLDAVRIQLFSTMLDKAFNRKQQGATVRACQCPVCHAEAHLASSSHGSQAAQLSSQNGNDANSKESQAVQAKQAEEARRSFLTLTPVVVVRRQEGRTVWVGAEVGDCTASWPDGIVWEGQIRAVGTRTWVTLKPDKHLLEARTPPLQPGVSYEARARVGMSAAHSWSGAPDWQAWGPEAHLPPADAPAPAPATAADTTRAAAHAGPSESVLDRPVGNWADEVSDEEAEAEAVAHGGGEARPTEATAGTVVGVHAVQVVPVAAAATAAADDAVSECAPPRPESPASLSSGHDDISDQDLSRYPAPLITSVGSITAVVDCVIESKEGKECRLGRQAVEADAAMGPVAGPEAVEAAEGGGEAVGEPQHGSTEGEECEEGEEAVEECGEGGRYEEGADEYEEGEEYYDEGGEYYEEGDEEYYEEGAYNDDAGEGYAGGACNGEGEGYGAEEGGEDDEFYDTALDSSSAQKRSGPAGGHYPTLPHAAGTPSGYTYKAHGGSRELPSYSPSTPGSLCELSLSEGGTHSGSTDKASAPDRPLPLHLAYDRPPPGFVPRKDCKFFLYGKCLNGDRCWFKHDPLAQRRFLAAVARNKATNSVGPGTDASRHGASANTASAAASKAIATLAVVAKASQYATAALSKPTATPPPRATNTSAPVVNQWHQKRYTQLHEQQKQAPPTQPQTSQDSVHEVYHSQPEHKVDDDEAHQQPQYQYQHQYQHQHQHQHQHQRQVEMAAVLSQPTSPPTPTPTPYPPAPRSASDEAAPLPEEAAPTATAAAAATATATAAPPGFSAPGVYHHSLNAELGPSGTSAAPMPAAIPSMPNHQFQPQQQQQQQQQSSAGMQEALQAMLHQMAPAELHQLHLQLQHQHALRVQQAQLQALHQSQHQHGGSGEHQGGYPGYQMHPQIMYVPVAVPVPVPMDCNADSQAVAAAQASAAAQLAAATNAAQVQVAGFCGAESGLAASAASHAALIAAQQAHQAIHAQQAAAAQQQQQQQHHYQMYQHYQAPHQEPQVAAQAAPMEAPSETCTAALAPLPPAHLPQPEPSQGVQPVPAPAPAPVHASAPSVPHMAVPQPAPTLPAAPVQSSAMPAPKTYHERYQARLAAQQQAAAGSAGAGAASASIQPAATAPKSCAAACAASTSSQAGQMAAVPVSVPVPAQAAATALAPLPAAPYLPPMASYTPAAPAPAAAPAPVAAPSKASAPQIATAAAAPASCPAAPHAAAAATAPAPAPAWPGSLTSSTGYVDPDARRRLLTRPPPGTAAYERWIRDEEERQVARAIMESLRDSTSAASRRADNAPSYTVVGGRGVSASAAVATDAPAAPAAAEHLGSQPPPPPPRPAPPLSVSVHDPGHFPSLGAAAKSVSDVAQQGAPATISTPPGFAPAAQGAYAHSSYNPSTTQEHQQWRMNNAAAQAAAQAAARQQQAHPAHVVPTHAPPSSLAAAVRAPAFMPSGPVGVPVYSGGSLRPVPTASANAAPTAAAAQPTTAPAVYAAVPAPAPFPAKQVSTVATAPVAPAPPSVRRVLPTAVAMSPAQC